MAAHRYWRAQLLATYGGGPVVELSEFWLLSASLRADSPATLTCDVSPLSGAIASLKDDNQSTFVELPVGAILTWDFGGSPVDVDDIRLGSSDSNAKFLGAARLDWSDDGVAWTTSFPIMQVHPEWYAWPGPRAMTTSAVQVGWDPASLSNTKSVAGSEVVESVTTNAYAKGAAVRRAGVLQFEFTAPFWRTAAGVLYLGVSRFLGSVGGVYRSLNSWVFTPYEGTKTTMGGAPTAYTTAWPASSSDVLGVVVDFTAGTITFYKNGVSLGVAYSNLSGESIQPYVAIPMANVSVTLKVSGLQYPVAGATPWAEAYITSAPRPQVPRPVSWFGVGGHTLYQGQAQVARLTTARSSMLFSPYARGRVVGTVKRKDTPANVPLSRRVRLYRDRDGMLIRETWSNAQGAYQFDYLEEWEAYTAISYDHTQTYRAVAADNLTLANGGITLIP